MSHTVSAIDWPVDQPIPYTVAPLALDGVPNACPSWCKDPGHRADYCVSERAELTTVNGGANFHAYLFRTEEDEPVVAVFSEDNHGAELDLAGLDKLIDDTEVFLPKLRALRRQLAASARPAADVREPLHGADADRVRDRLREPSNTDVAARVARRLLLDYARVDYSDVFALNQAYGAVTEALRILLRAVDIEGGARA
ncbi:hypothetical protein HUT18_14050 [Streptomyces sp. NA04227]|uniref:DUF6907 domain-containing protein n=1 Tax=Streptomyces sp. NA04227 TaxID=2742136 RepID=UPI00159002E1|nr:hypothetical protein [Streptomyces sp. NA04227]QKW07343.1 hypothetical protein HUT18_14050 [Streptomyces sp. NA04227]